MCKISISTKNVCNNFIITIDNLFINKNKIYEYFSMKYKVSNKKRIEFNIHK